MKIRITIAIIALLNFLSSNALRVPKKTESAPINFLQTSNRVNRANDLNKVFDDSLSIDDEMDNNSKPRRNNIDYNHEAPTSISKLLNNVRDDLSSTDVSFKFD